jgi:Bax protein
MSKAVWSSVWRTLSFERAALVFTGLSVVTLYALVLSQPPALPQKTAKQKPVSEQANIRPLTESDWQIPDRLTKRSAAKPIGVLSIAPTEKLKKIFDQIGYRLDTVRSHRQVPRVFVAAVPRDLPKLREPAERKNVFIKMTLPLVLHVNELILQTRVQVKALQKKRNSGKLITIEDQQFLEKVAAEYGLEKPDIDQLLKRVDIIPPSLALAQSAEESGWGTSRFAREGNALFGQRTWRSTTGLVPENREEGKKFKVRAFDHLLDGVKAYARNLNSHPYYSEFRERRTAMRQSNDQTIDGMKLVATLIRYSERGEDYIATIQNLIRINRFTAFDDTKLLDQLGDRLENLMKQPDGPDA